MKKFIICIFIIASVLSSFTSCVKDRLLVDENGDQYIELVINTSDLETKADDSPYGELYESMIVSLDYFVYKSGETDHNAKKYGHIEQIRSQGTETIRISTTETDLNENLIPRPLNDCVVYVVANLVNTDAHLPDFSKNEDTSLNTIKSIVFNSNFLAEKTDEDGSNLALVMDGQGNVEIINRRQKVAARGNVKLTRLASKFTININVVNSYEDTAHNTTWTPYPEGMKVEFYHAARNTALDCDIQKAPASGRFFNYPENECTQINGRTFTTRPFYSYRNVWEYNTDSEPFFIITVPWHTENQPNQNLFYKVLLDSNNIERNSWYHINLTVSTLGSFDKMIPKVLVNETKYYVFDWQLALEQGKRHDVEAAINDARYIMVPQTNYEIDNVKTISIPFTSSHTCTITNIHATHTVYDIANNIFKTEDVDGDLSQMVYISNDGKVIEFNHSICNDFNENLDTTPYTFTFTIQHADNIDFYENVTVVQSPAVVVSESANPFTIDGVDQDCQGTYNIKSQYQKVFSGWTYVNGQDRQYIWIESNGGSASNSYYYNIRTRPLSDKTQYMYVIQTKVLPSGTSYILKDPRNDVGMENQIIYPLSIDPSGTKKPIFEGTDPATLTGNGPGLADGPALFGSSPRKMQYYYATQTTGDVDKYISPKFRIASRYCSAGNVGVGTKYKDMLRRCATYQEYGYPAGRWRLPTYSELEYIAELQKLHKIPEILTDGGYSGSVAAGYFYSTGSIGITASGSGDNYTCDYRKHTATEFADNGHSIRCVYDDWYWEQTDNNGGKVPLNTFTWGDKQR